MPTRAAVARRILGLMGENRVHQTELATVLGMSQPTLSRRLDAKKAFDVDELDAIAAYFDVPVTDLFPRDKEGQMGSHRELVAAGQRRARPPDPRRLDEAA